MSEKFEGNLPPQEHKEKKEQEPVLKFKEVLVWCPNDVEIDGGKYSNSESLGKDVDLVDVLDWAEQIHNQGGSIQAYLPDGRYLSSYVGIYNKDESPANRTGIGWAVKGKKESK